LAVWAASEMTYIVLGGALNSTQQLSCHQAQHVTNCINRRLSIVLVCGMMSVPVYVDHSHEMKGASME